MQEAKPKKAASTRCALVLLACFFAASSAGIASDSTLLTTASIHSNSNHQKPQVIAILKDPQAKQAHLVGAEFEKVRLVK